MIIAVDGNGKTGGNRHHVVSIPSTSSNNSTFLLHKELYLDIMIVVVHVNSIGVFRSHLSASENSKDVVEHISKIEY